MVGTEKKVGGESQMEVEGSIDVGVKDVFEEVFHAVS